MATVVHTVIMASSASIKRSDLCIGIETWIRAESNKTDL